MSKSERRPRKRPAAPRTHRLPADLTLGISAAFDKKADQLVVLDLRPSKAFTDFFVICTGTSARQVHAIADAVQDALRAKGIKPAFVEGYSSAGWILIDYFDFIFHIFTPATREFYALERLWGDAVTIEMSDASSE
jgi:ribosome-associated protein